jgi:hypothetical protein
VTRLKVTPRQREHDIVVVSQEGPAVHDAVPR